MAKKKKNGFIRGFKDSLQSFYLSYRKALLGLGFVAFSSVLLYTLPLVPAILGSAAVFFGSYIVYERKRRMNWETALSFKMMDMHRQQDEILQNIDEKPASAKRRKAPSFAANDASPAGKAQSFQDIINYDALKEMMEAGTAAPTEPTFMDMPAPKARPEDNTPKAAKPMKAPLSGKSASKAASAKPEAYKSRALNAGIRALPDEIFYSDSLIKEFLTNAINAENIAVLRQPVMSLPQRSSRLYMLSAQIEAYTNEFLEEKHYFKIARSFGLHHRIFDLLLAHAIEQLEKGADMQFGISIESATLHNSKFMNRLLKFLKKSPDLAHRIVLDFRFTDFNAMEPGFLQIIRSLAALKCQFMISGIDRLDFDHKLMRSLNARTLRLKVGTLLPMMDVAEHFHDAITLRRTLEAHGMRLVLDGIQNEAQLKAFDNFSPRFAYGDLFAASAHITRSQESAFA